MSDSDASAESVSLLERLIPDSFYTVFREERTFLALLGVFFFVAGVSFPNAEIAKWVGFALAGYSAIANDSIQTIGTFIASNEDKKWWVLWLFIGGIFLATVSYSWYAYDGDVSYQRLASKGFSEAPASFTFLQIAAPIFLLMLTRMRMPVSTTFLLLSCFAADASAIGSVLEKSLSGYLVAFVASIIVWIVLSGVIKKFIKGKPHPMWTGFQWLTSGSLWAVWIMQDAANIAVYLPRSMTFNQFAVFALYIFFGLGILFYLRGDKIQKVVTEKSDVRDIRSATIIDFVYAIILYYFKIKSQIPMSTTWVFIGLLAGREIAMTFTDARGKGKPLKKSLKLIGKDVGYALIGLAVSIALAVAINPEIDDEILNYFLG
ncbi:hypothetical protein G3570_11405 [Balneolaceae bacterium YR4-1]|uniref:Phosphate/sulfate permease n=1 Tax=Halalkalibaculum roseum TaxID=2709311 RepID=A0A6M1T5G6_9BACT|nr:hypothetical protein [Halalkalibaculum roseum]NGP77245.1 hypothetical protein [Halalkalibaculum roseum]